ncbi:hypothetical protein Acsp05_71180 [Actinokineospora sp. NBRC 105648]|nr:hypothetical protein Acsp05_71180 [Actinokineospora sp. NBRC 105648]
MRTLLLFDGLGGNTDGLVPALRELYSRPENAAYFHGVFTVLDDVLRYGDPGADILPDGLDLRHWLDFGFPSTVLDNSVVAGVCVHVHQVCHLLPTGPVGRLPVVGALGHSIGLQAAIVAGLRSRRLDDFLAVAAGSLRLVAISLVRGHQVFLDRVGPEALDRERDSRGRMAGPMAALTGVSRSDLATAVEKYNADNPGALTLSLVNSPAAHVLSGAAEHLVDFSRLDTVRANWAFLPNTIPFHSELLAPAARLVRDDLDFIGPVPTPADLAIPVYATDRPRLLNDSADLVEEFLDQVLVRPIDWPAAVRFAVDGVDRVLDVGPGPGARRFTRECLPARSVRFQSPQQLT